MGFTEYVQYCMYDCNTRHLLPIFYSTEYIHCTSLHYTGHPSTAQRERYSAVLPRDGWREGQERGNGRREKDAGEGKGGNGEDGERRRRRSHYKRSPSSLPPIPMTKQEPRVSQLCLSAAGTVVP